MVSGFWENSLLDSVKIYESTIFVKTVKGPVFEHVHNAYEQNVTIGVMPIANLFGHICTSVRCASVTKSNPGCLLIASAYQLVTSAVPHVGL